MDNNNNNDESKVQYEATLRMFRNEGDAEDVCRVAVDFDPEPTPGEEIPECYTIMSTLFHNFVMPMIVAPSTVEVEGNGTVN